MHFGLTEEQEMLQETVRGFVANECPPPKLREIFDAGTGNDPALWSGIVEMGLTGLVIPEEHEGAGMEMLEAYGLPAHSVYLLKEGCVNTVVDAERVLEIMELGCDVDEEPDPSSGVAA